MGDVIKSLLDNDYKHYWSGELTKDQIQKAENALLQITSYSTAAKSDAENTEKIIQRFTNEKLNGNDDIISIDFQVAIDFCAKSSHVEHAEDILKQMNSMNEACPDSAISDVKLYNTVIHAWKRNGQAKRAESTLLMMKDRNVKPDSISYNGVILAYCAGNSDVEYAETLLEEMEKAQVKIDVFLYNSILDAYAKSQHKNSAKKAEALLTKMEEKYADKGGNDDGVIQPNTISYTTVINAYAKMQSKDSAINAERVFKRMEAAYQAGNENARPNTQSFNTVINAWVQSRSPGCALKAEEILMKMFDLNRDGINVALPNVVTFTTVMNGWAKSAESGCGHRAQKLYELALKEYNQGNLEAAPNSFMYSALIGAWTKSKDKGSVQKACKIFIDLHDAYENESSSVKPSTFLGNQVIDAVSRSGESDAGKTAEKILNILVSLYNKYNDSEMTPNAQSYSFTLNAWAKSRTFGKAKRAHQILQKMENAYKEGNRDVKPNVFAITAVLNACAFTLGDIIEKKEALQIASATYKKLTASDYGKPNSVTFATFLRVCLNLIPKGPSQRAALGSIFKKCCEHGQVNDLILDIMRNSVPREEMEEIIGQDLGEGRLTVAKIPHEYKCNAKESVRRYPNRTLGKELKK